MKPNLKFEVQKMLHRRVRREKKLKAPRYTRARNRYEAKSKARAA